MKYGAVIISPIVGGNYGGSFISNLMARYLAERGMPIYFFYRKSLGVPPELSKVHKVEVPDLFEGALLPDRWPGALRSLRRILRCRPSVIIVVGDVPRLRHALLQFFARVIFFRQDTILTCPSNRRFLPNSRSTCSRPVGFGCLAVSKKEGCLAELTLVKQVGRIVFRLRDRFKLALLKNFLTLSSASALRHRRTETIIYPPLMRGDPLPTPRRVLHRLVFCGRLEDSKGPADAVKALSLLPHSYTLDIVGDGPERTSLEQLASSLQLGGRTKFHGWLSPQERDHVLSSAGALLVPSLWDESFGMIGIEAFAQGTPVAAYAVGGIPEWCVPPAGMLVPCGDVVMLAAAALTLTGDRNAWSRRSAAALIAAKGYEEPVFYGRLEEILFPEKQNPKASKITLGQRVEPSCRL